MESLLLIGGGFGRFSAVGTVLWLLKSEERRERFDRTRAGAGGGDSGGTGKFW